MDRKFYTVILVILASIMSLTNESHSQSIPLLTDPIKVRELELMSNQIGLTAIQQEALLEVYDRYLEDFSRVRADEIKTFEDGIAEAAETFGFMQFQIPERELVEGLIRKAQRAMRAIHNSDSLFFDEVAGMLTEKQRNTLKRTEVARELEAYELLSRGMIGEINNGARSQMRELYTRLESESNAELEEVLELYDQRYLKQVKESFEVVIATVRLALDMVDELGVRGQDQQALMMRFIADPEAIEDLKRRGEILLKPLVDQAHEVSQLNWKTWNKIDALLDVENARKFQQWYFGKSFSDAIRGGDKIRTYLETAIGLNSITEGQRIDLMELQKSFHSKWSNMTEKHAEVLEKSRQIQTIAIMSGEVTSGFKEQLSTLKDSRREYISRTESRIDSILGKELLAQLKGDKTNPKSVRELPPGMTGKVEGSVVITSDGDGAEFQVVVGSTDGRELTPKEIEELKKAGKIQTVELKNENGEWVDAKGQSIEIRTIDSVDKTIQGEKTAQLVGGATIPQPIAPSFPERAAVVLELDDTDVIIIDAVYNEYREKYDEAYQTIASGSKEIEENTALSRGERMRKNRDISKTAADAVAELDTAMFDDIAVVHSISRNDTNLKMLEDHRNRQRLSAPDNPFGWRGGEGDTIDLVGLYVMSKESDTLSEGLSKSAQDAILQAMQGYHAQVADVHHAYVKATYNLAHMQDAMWIMEEADQNSRMAESIQRRWRDAFTSLRDTKRLLMLVNQTVMDTLLKSVPESDFWTIRMEFVQKAYPDVFTKSSDVSPMLTAASAIQNLNVTQKSQLESLGSTYRFDLWNLCEAMIENHQSNAAAKGGEGYMDKEDIHRALRLETLRFERRELNDRIRMRLRMVLNDEQIKFVPGLRPSVSTAKEWRW